MDVLSPAPFLLFRPLVLAALVALGGLAAAGEPLGPRADALGDPLPAGARFRLGTVRLRHGGKVRRVALSPDNKLVASVSNDRTLSLWDVKTGRELHRLPLGEENSRPLLAFCPGGKLLAANLGGKLCLLDVSTGRVVRRFPGEAAACSFPPDGKTVIAVLGKGPVWQVRRWPLSGGEGARGWELRGGRKEADFFISPDGAVLALSEEKEGGGCGVRLFDTAGGKELRRWEVPGRHLFHLAFSPDGKRLAGGTESGMVRVWDAATGKELARWEVDRVNGRGGLLLGGRLYGTFWSAFSPDGTELYTSAEGRGLRVWDWAAHEEKRRLSDMDGPFTLSRDGRVLAAGGWPWRVCLLDPATGKDLCPLPHCDSYPAPVFSPDGRRLAASIGGTVCLWDVASGKQQRALQTREVPVSIVFSPDGRRLASMGSDDRVRVWDVDSGRELRSFAGANVQALTFTPDGGLLVTTSVGDAKGYEAILWDIATGKKRARWHSPDIIHLSPDGGLVASVERDAKRVHLRDASTGKRSHVLQSCDAVVIHRVRWEDARSSGMSACGEFFWPRFSPDGSLLLAAEAGYSTPADPKGVCIWDVATGRPRHRLSDYEYALKNIAFSPDDKLLVLTRCDLTTCLYDVSRGAVLRELGKVSREDNVFAAAPVFSGDGRLVVFATCDGSIRLHEVATGKELCRRKGHRGWVTELLPSPDGRGLASVSDDGTILVWNLTCLVTDGEPRPKSLTGKGLEALWADLASPDARRGRRAVELLADNRAVPFLRRRLESKLALDAKRVARLVADLDDDRFTVRQKATAELEKLGERAEPALRAVLAARPSLEVRKRAEVLLEKLTGAVLLPERLRTLRAIQALEVLGTVEARRALETLAKGPSGTSLTAEARAALRRLTHR